MGAEQIGIIAVGPLKITKRRIERATKVLLDKESADTCGNCGDKLCGAASCEACGTKAPTRFESETDARRHAEAAASGWPPDFRDVSSREYGSKWIVFAGEQTWGDTPDGAGYRYLNGLIADGIYAALGLE